MGASTGVSGRAIVVRLVVRLSCGAGLDAQLAEEGSPGASGASKGVGG